MRGAKTLLCAMAPLLLVACADPVTPAPEAVDFGLAPPAGQAAVVVSASGVAVQLNGPTVKDAFQAVAAAANVAVKVDEEVGQTHHLFLSFHADDAEDALRKLARLAELRLDRETFAGMSVYRIGPPREIFATDLWHLLAAAVLLLCAFLGDRILDVILRRRERVSRKGATRLKQVAPLARVVIWLFSGTSALLMVLSVPPSTALALTGGGLLLVGLASKEFAANILSGLAIAVDRPLHLGDYVNVGEYSGEVVRIGLRSTQLVTLDDTRITVPNVMIATQEVASSNYGEIEALIPVEFHVAHDADVTRVRALVWEGVVTSAYCSWRRPVHVIVSEELWSTKVVVHAYVFDVRHQLLFVSDVTHRVKTAFAEHGIRYPTAPLAGIAPA
jgi:small-conductance mechanosensitive channel